MAKAPVKGMPSHAEARDEVDDIWGEALAELFGIGIVATVPRAAPAPREIATKVSKPKKPTRKRST